ncbi:hypothetical protein LOCC1_G006355 [Lachnellula occidentalis]|uniref:Uncharacterized protein n=1 Tax=Lachnellula occidentalis TaxID=215460 RepID=A0A8H8S080_9HELO|nr:hypothetical protein LOCC1_G006355 [Lachnellula occidentalis]
MSVNNCTALIQYVAPKRPRSSPPLTFLSLPREIRDEIYNMALISASPIIVWKAEWEWDIQYFPPLDGPRWPEVSTRIRWRLVDQEAISTSLQSLDMNIILCNKIVGREAAKVFYRKNTFSFLGKHNWDPIVSWLESIGAANRNSLLSLEINACRPDPAWQRSSGERRSLPTETLEELYPRHPYLHLRTDEKPFKYGRVENLNPAMEMIFVLLGQKTSKKKVTIVMQLGCVMYPGGRIARSYFDTNPEGSWFSMDLPNLMEKFRSLHTQHVEVLWKGNECRRELEDQQAIMESIGWNVTVLPMEEDELHPYPKEHGCHDATDEWRIAKYILRRENLTGPLFAQEPCPYNYVVPRLLHEYN